MKLSQLYILSAMCFFTKNMVAQPCQFANAKHVMHVNQIRASIGQGGQLFSGGQNAALFPTDQNGNNSVASIFASSFWLGGIDPGGNLKLSTSTHLPGFYAGPLDVASGLGSQPDCKDWNKVFSVTRAEIQLFKSVLTSTGSASAGQFPAVFGWPGRGNPHFSGVHGFDLPIGPSSLAPFFDLNLDGAYNPLDGDFPVVQLQGQLPFVPDDIAWSVFNDASPGSGGSFSGASPIQVEVQQTVWAFNCTDNPVLNSTIFSSHKVINRGLDNTDSFYVGLWTDLDLGCNEDDYFGCNPGKDCFYVYNTDAIDGNVGNSCGPVQSFTGNIPIQTGIFLNKKLDKFLPLTPNGATGMPTTAIQYYQNLSGNWGDGTLLTAGGTGYGGTVPTNFAYPDDPANSNGWSMCTTFPPIADRSVVASTKIGVLQPGQTEEIDVAWMTHWPDSLDLPCSIGKVMTDVDAVRVAFDNQFANVCSQVTLDAPEETQEQLVSIDPNPTSGEFLVKTTTALVEIRVFSAAGRLINKILGEKTGQTPVSLSAHPSGIYWVEIALADRVLVKKLVVSR